ncbi:MAG: sulfite exporter TauE/SafE family protein [Hyphomicrobiales bacterium]|nr:sulfite exporter TauE/SafE family protein [Hyphomicrobiales bacterium]
MIADTFLGVPLSELLALAGLIIAGGLVTGILAGLFGIGGGALIVPVLYEVFRVLGVPDDVRFQLCVGTSIAIIVPTNVLSFLTHRGKGAVLGDVVRVWAVPSVVGVAAGSTIAAFASPAVLKLAFVLVGSVIAFKLLFGRDSWRLADRLPGRIGLTIYGFFVGLAASMMGISGGSISNMILTLHGVSMHNAVATSAGLGVPITIAGTIGYLLAGLPHQAEMPPLSLGFVSLIGFALMAPVASFTAPYGARLAHALSRRRLEVAFGCFLFVVCVRFVLSLVS